VNGKYETHEHDVLIIGAGGAGLRAAIEALAQGASVGVVCKSLLGKAHTVMAEGGIAAAMANVDEADDWRVHFGDTMRGGKMLNNWRMAQIHAQEASEACASWSNGALYSIAPRTAVFCNAPSEDTLSSACVTSAIAPVWK
jgi:succinate dehydrogenase / fumarate reductase, flavoprotein subunit